MLILAVQVFENGFVVDTVMKIMGHGLVGRMFWCATFGNRREETLLSRWRAGGLAISSIHIPIPHSDLHLDSSSPTIT